MGTINFRDGFKFHGGCTGCTVNDLKICTGCQCFEYDWELPCLNPKKIKEAKIREEMVKKAKS